ncbi:MAG: hypothetical protein K2Q21_02350 [Chitinophagaceae bacterium]|nr:hypothetical protein [Chitinophagaceae bacterium]
MADQVLNTANNKNPLKGLFNYQWIVKNIPFFLFLTGLTVLYIANGHNADRIIRKINATETELKELQFEYKTLKSEVMFKSEEVEVLKAATPLGLKISRETPQRLKHAENK